MQRFLLLPVLLAVLWLICFAAPVFLLWNLTSLPVQSALVISVLATPVYFFIALRCLRHGPDLVAHICMQWLGVGTLALPLLLPALLATPWLPAVWVGLGFLLAWMLMVGYGRYRAQQIIEPVFTLTDSRLTETLRIAQLSDVHIGSRPSGFLQSVVTKVNAMQPDVALITGDLVDLTRVEAADLHALSRLQCPVFMCLGNHERYINLDKVLSAIGAQGVRVLRDELVLHRGLQLIGIDDADSSRYVQQRLQEIVQEPGFSHDRYTVVLYHRPDGWAFVCEQQLPLMLAGHTHNGQIWPFGVLVRRQFREIAGWYQRGVSRLYVSQGTGTWGPTFRFGTQAEIALFVLQPGSAPEVS